MAITEQQRFEMHLELRKHLGDDVANTLMEHLPPSGWSDVVRLNDLTGLEQRMGLRINVLEVRMGGLEKRMNTFEKRMDAFEKRITRTSFGLASLVVGSTVTIVTLLFQIKTGIR